MRHLEDRTLQTQKPKRPRVSETRVAIKEGEWERETDLILCMPNLLAPALSGLLVRLVARSRSTHSNKVARPDERLDERLSSDLLGLGVSTRLKLAGMGVADERQNGVLGVSDAVKEVKKVKMYRQGVSTMSSTRRVVPHEHSKDRAEKTHQQARISSPPDGWICHSAQPAPSRLCSVMKNCLTALKLAARPISLAVVDSGISE